MEKRLELLYGICGGNTKEEIQLETENVEWRKKRVTQLTQELEREEELLRYSQEKLDDLLAMAAA